jgi:hypothetical protein
MVCRKPDFFIVGAPRCGTTAMYSYLKSHPEIFMSSVKEPRYFCRDLDSGSDAEKDYWTREESDYLKFFEGAGDARRVGEASPFYLYSRVAAQAIREFCGPANIIVMLRNPVDMMYSFHNEQVYHGMEDIADFRAALDAEPDRKNGIRLPKKRNNIKALYYRDVATFSEQVQRYFDIFGKERVLVILHDDLHRDPASVYRTALEFLEVDPGFTPDFRIVNPRKTVRSASFHQLMIEPPHLFRRIVRALVPDTPRYKIIKLVSRLNRKTKTAKRMDPDLRRALVLEFSGEVERLGRLIGRDLSDWREN